MELQSYEYTFKVENSVRAQLTGILTYRLHEKVIKVPNVRPLPPPPPKVLSNAYTLFFDGAFRRATGKARGGLFLVNPVGEVVMKEQVTLDGSTSNNEAEYDVLISGSKICLAQKIRRLMVKGDALLIVKQILGIWACKNERLRTKVTSIRKLFSQFEEVQLYHIPRKENEDANLLAQQAVSNQDKTHVVIAAIALKDPQYADHSQDYHMILGRPCYAKSRQLVQAAWPVIAKTMNMVKGLEEDEEEQFLKANPDLVSLYLANFFMILERKTLWDQEMAMSKGKEDALPKPEPVEEVIWQECDFEAQMTKVTRLKEDELDTIFLGNQEETKPNHISW
ncbi:hypothetical protein L7F22_059606 [Adiantum nelumboides]|nr:hypothetical protein [Adiantum nelumboides]